MNDKKMGMYYALGIIEGFIKSDKDYKRVELGDIFNEKYEEYSIGQSSEFKEIILYKGYDDDKKRKRVIEITTNFSAPQIVELLLAALSYDMKN